MTLIGKGGVGESIAQHHIPTGQGRRDHLLDVISSGCKNQQGFGQGIHGLVQDHLTQSLRQRRATRLTGQRHLFALLTEQVGQPLDVGGFAGTVDAFKADEQTVGHAAIVPWQKKGQSAGFDNVRPPRCGQPGRR